MFYKLRDSFFLSNYIRIIFCFAAYSVFTIQLYAQWLDAYIPDFKVNDDNLNSYQTSSSIGVDSAGNFVIVWNDVRNNPGNQSPYQVYCQRYSKYGQELGNNFKIGQDTSYGGNIQVLRDGRFIVLWASRYLNYSFNDIYFRRFDKNGNALSVITKINDTTISTGSGYCLGSNSFGGFVACWAVFYSSSSTKLYFQRYDSSGVRLGTAKIVNEGNSRVESPEIAINNDGSFVIVWQDDRLNNQYAKFDVFMQRYDASGIKVGNNVKVNDDTDTMTQQYIGNVSTDRQGYTIVTWADERLSPIDGIYYQLYDINGMAIGTNRRADITSEWFSTGLPKVSMREDRKYFIGWLDRSYAGKEQYYGRRFDGLGNPIGNPYMIPSFSPGDNEQRPDDLFLFNDRVYATWTDFIQNDLNTDIWCNVRGFQNPDTIIIGVNPISANIPKGFKLYPAYPNPFNPETKIKYDLPKDDAVFISIYNIQGRTIKLINTGKQNKGTYDISITNELLSSGVYFLKVITSSGLNAVQKLVLLK